MYFKHILETPFYCVKQSIQNHFQIFWGWMMNALVSSFSKGVHLLFFHKYYLIVTIWHLKLFNLIYLINKIFIYELFCFQWKQEVVKLWTLKCFWPIYLCTLLKWSALYKVASIDQFPSKLQIIFLFAII